MLCGLVLLSSLSPIRAQMAATRLHKVTNEASYPAIRDSRVPIRFPACSSGLALLGLFALFPVYGLLYAFNLLAKGSPYWPLLVTRGVAGVIALVELWRLARLGITAAGHAAAKRHG